MKPIRTLGNHNLFSYPGKQAESKSGEKTQRYRSMRNVPVRSCRKFFYNFFFFGGGREFESHLVNYVFNKARTNLKALMTKIYDSPIEGYDQQTLQCIFC
ncbi:unnamed protein product [Ilex paraguariensis]|uniref:Uncharacterized protein n=1 Tax=Ilex paraguariensis TaxID=185542 RepID=A0ABC8S9P6_9AQUA